MVGMRLTRGRASGGLVVLLAAFAVAGGMPADASAATATATGTVTGSALSVATSSTPSFSANLDSGDVTASYSLALSTIDTRGTGAGWNETITSTQFTTGGASPQTLATNASTVTGITTACASGTCTNPTNAISYPVAVPAGATPPTAVKFFNAAANSGLGKFTITPTVSVFVPQNTFAGTYTSTLTISIVSGP
jgi:putative surface cell wall-binding protein